MKLTINEKKENPLLDRTEVEGHIDFEGSTPSNQDVAESLSKQFKKDIGLVVVKKVYTLFSRQEANFLAFVYDDVVARNHVEKATKHLRKKAEEAKKKEAEGKKEEAPSPEPTSTTPPPAPESVEEKKEELKAEEKSE